MILIENFYKKITEKLNKNFACKKIRNTISGKSLLNY